MDSPPTWGIPGPVFLVGFGLAALLLTAFAVAVRNRSVDRMPVLPELHSYALAPLGSRPTWEEDVVAASLVFLRSRDLVAVEGDGTLRAAGDGEDLTEPLDRAVLRALADGMRLGEIKGHPLVGSELARLGEEYRVWKDGLWLDHLARMRWSGLALLPLVLLLPLGVVRLWAGMANGRPVLFLLILLLVLVGGIAFLSRRWVPRRSSSDWAERFREKGHAIVRARLRTPHSRPPQDEAGRRTAGLVLSMAYFGSADLAAADPELDAVIKGVPQPEPERPSEPERTPELEPEPERPSEPEPEPEPERPSEPEPEPERTMSRREERKRLRAAKWAAAMGGDAEKAAQREKAEKAERTAARRERRSSRGRSRFSSGSSYGGAYDGPSSGSSSSSGPSRSSGSSGSGSSSGSSSSNDSGGSSRSISCGGGGGGCGGGGGGGGGCGG
ncbi:TIGR04222 domain-containing membrane protein [Actinocorallia libanotica]|uniref:TIGR04222 domain-containing membrane protein n=1 Tax=Actinocorallia libanotica TaxID=46162 RepID=A0ABP4BUY0_9ACTN